MVIVVNFDFQAYIHLHLFTHQITHSQGHFSQHAIKNVLDHKTDWRYENRCCQFCVSKLLWISFLLKHRWSMGCLSHVRPARRPRCKGISLSLSSTVFLFFLFLYLFLTNEGPSLLHFTCRPKGKRAAEKRS